MFIKSNYTKTVQILKIIANLEKKIGYFNSTDYNFVFRYHKTIKHQ